MSTAFPLEQPTVAIHNSEQLFPVHRIYCVGRNYAEHAREMGANPEREAPFFFCKPADAVVPNHSSIAYPSSTKELHHEIELVVAIGGQGRQVTVDRAQNIIFGYAVGIDLTRRDLQSQAKKQSRPWDTAKGFDQSAPLTAIHKVKDCGHINQGLISLSINDELKQKGDIADLIWSVPEIIAQLSTLFELKPGDLIFTGTPAGVGPLNVGDKVLGKIRGLDDLVITISE